MLKLSFNTCFIITLAFLLSCKTREMQSNQYVFVGTYTDGSHTNGIYIYNFDENKGTLREISHTDNIANPSYLALTKDEKYLYAVNENPDTINTVSAFSFDKEKGLLHFLNKVPANGSAACFVTVDSTGKVVIESNYGSGNFSVYKTEDGGKLSSAVQIIQHIGKSINQNQSQARAHSTILSPDERFLFVCDLGNDTLYQYPFDAKSAKPVDEPHVKTYKINPGFGPRHLAFAPGGKFVYLLCELEAKVIAYSFQDDSLTYLQTITSTDIPDSNDKGSAAIRISPDGKILYTSNRGKANDIAVFKINENGTLDSVAKIKTDKHPRDFNISSDGKFLLVASRDDNTIKVYSIHADTGKLSYINQSVSVSKPVSILFNKK